MNNQRNCEENEHPKPPKWRPEPSQIEPRGRQAGVRTPKKPKKNIDLTKSGAGAGWGAGVARSPLFCWVYLLFRFFGRPGPLLAPSGLDLGGFGPPFCRFLVPIFFIISNFLNLIFSTTLALWRCPGCGWAGGVTRSAKNFNVHFLHRAQCGSLP